MSKFLLLGTLVALALQGGVTPSPGTPEEGGGEGFFLTHHSSLVTAQDPHPNPLPGYRERGQGAESGDVRFSAVDVFVDSGPLPLAAYQFELKVTAGDVALVGVEGGEHRAFKSPPYYDPRALARQRIVVAALDAGSDLPSGKTRVARLMVRVSGAATPEYDATLVVAASGDAKPIPATISVSNAPDSEGAER